MNDLDNLKYVTGELPDTFTKWHAVFMKLLATFREDLSELKVMLMVSKAKSKWLDNFGALVELDRPTAQVYLQQENDNEKAKKDDFYRLIILLKATSLYDDYTYNVFSELAKVFKVGERLLVNIFDGFVQYSFINLTTEELEFVASNYLLLNNFKVGRKGLRITKGQETTFRLGGPLGTKFSEVLYNSG